MNRKSVFVAGILLIAGLAGSAAQAHQWGCWIQRDRNIAIRNASGGGQADAAISDWHNMTILNFNYVSSGEEIYVFNANSGATGWAGLARITNYSGCTIYRATAQVNTYYYSGTSTAARGIHCQEIGHGFGLDHSNDGGCMGAGYWYSVTNAYRPVTHNVNDVGSMYQNKHNGVDHEAVSPKFHANWFHNPRTLGEATRLSTHVVVATANFATDGDPISIGEEGTIPSQRVHFTVKNSRKGSLKAGESFVLFQNGNDQNRFDEDPSYKAGHRYLLFLTEREDGTYMVIGPAGRYHVTRNGLVPAVHREKSGFAANLAGASLPDVMADVERALEEVPEK
ncbi:MAG TPA: hypothetical protein VIW92_12470 [Thermoanaerobaculia bacterium]